MNSGEEKSSKLDLRDNEDSAILTDDGVNLSHKKTKEDKLSLQGDENPLNDTNYLSPSKWSYDVAKKRRSEGLPYLIKDKIRNAKAPKPVNCLCRYKCSINFSDEDRRQICAAYWKLGDFTRQKDYLLKSITTQTPQRRRPRTESGLKTQRKNSKFYFFERNGTTIRVCQVFFLKTLCISYDVVLNAFKYKGENGSYIGEDGRGKRSSANKTKPIIVAVAKPENKGPPKDATEDESSLNFQNPSTWSYNVAKKRRSEGLPYLIKNKIRDAKAPKSVNCLCRYKCSDNFSDEERRQLCANYWKLGDFTRQKDYLLKSITTQTPQRRRQRTESSPKTQRQNSKSYFFERNNTTIRVCQLFFLKTLCISNDVVLNAFKYKGENGSYVGEDKRGKSVPGNKLKTKMADDVKQHVESLPNVDLPGTRRHTKREYLNKHLNITKMYEMYLENCRKAGKEAEEASNHFMISTILMGWMAQCRDNSA